MLIPAGFPLSAYTPPNVHATPPPPPILADRWDPARNDIATLWEGDDPTDAALQWQCTIREGGGAALGSNGARFHRVTKGTDTAALQLSDEGRRIAARYVQRGDIRDVKVSGAVEGGSTAIGAVVIAYINEHTEQAARVRGGA